MSDPTIPSVAKARHGLAIYLPVLILTSVTCTCTSFADCLIERSAAAAGCEKTMTFDRGVAKSVGMTLLA
jgi:predicted nucleic-acid-binding protein